MPDMELCPLCGKPASFPPSSGQRLIVKCPRCGVFRLGSDAEFALPALDQEKKTLLSAYCRLNSGRNAYVPIATSSVFERAISSLPSYTPCEKMDNLLELMAERTEHHINYPTKFNMDTDYPLVIASGPDEVRYLMSELGERGLLNLKGFPPEAIITMKGWEHIEEVRRAGRSSSQAFVAMWFDPSADRTYLEAIAPAIEDAGYKPLRIDKHEHTNRIDDEIIGQIKRSRFMVADFTGQRHGVYFEAGMMLGLGHNVIWMCAKEELEKKEDGLHFDVRQFNFIAYDSVEDARERLYNRILAIEGEGPVHKEAAASA